MVCSHDPRLSCLVYMLLTLPAAEECSPLKPLPPKLMSLSQQAQTQPSLLQQEQAEQELRDPGSSGQTQEPESVTTLKTLLRCTSLDPNAAEPHYGYTPLSLLIEHLITKNELKYLPGADSASALIKTVPQAHLKVGLRYRYS